MNAQEAARSVLIEVVNILGALKGYRHRWRLGS